MSNLLNTETPADLLNDADLTLMPVQQLLNAAFFIPAYQRGYRWTDVQVLQLLNDIDEFKRQIPPFARPEDLPFYCLQPVVVKNRTAGGLTEWEVIDGQQRLTTILIILHHFNETEFRTARPLFSIRYETRPDSATFLAKIQDAELAGNNIDYHHIHLAYQTISHWFEAREQVSPGFRNEFYPVLARLVKVIWYQVDDSSGHSDSASVEVFTRLNIGKIALTNSELIKALFLQKNNFETGKITLRQLQIAAEWDTIEKQLQDDAFWFFIYDIGNPLKYENRIEYIFDLMKGKKNEDEFYFTFNRFTESIQAPEADAGELWLEVKRYFLTFEEWFHDKEFYHLIGFLVDCGVGIDTLKLAARQKTKTQFRLDLAGSIKAQIAGELETLEYGDARTKKVLLLFNIQTLLATKGADLRFPFYRYKKEDWDIEHVRSKTQQQIAPGQRRDWLTGVLAYCSGLDDESPPEAHRTVVIALPEGEEKAIAEQILWLLAEKKIGDPEFDAVYKRISKHFREQDSPEEINSIANLALLDAGTNRSYKNAMFPVKRRHILDNDKNGVFVPICTRNLFSKSYSARMSDLIYWEAGDAADYLKAILFTLKPYLDTK